MEVALIPLVSLFERESVLNSFYSEDYKQLDEILCQSAIECIVREKYVQFLPLSLVYRHAFLKGLDLKVIEYLGCC